jgi:hypothetical protein
VIAQLGGSVSVCADTRYADAVVLDILRDTQLCTAGETE